MLSGNITHTIFPISVSDEMAERKNTLRRVLLIYPQSVREWRMATCQLPGCEEKKFNWFICGKRYWNEELNKYVVEVQPGIKLYDPAEGKNYTARHPLKLLVSSHSAISTLQKNGLDGYCYTKPCPNEIKNPDESLFCHEVSFYIFPDALKSLKMDLMECDLLLYSTTYHQQLREKVPNFPSPSEIQKMIEEKNCRRACKDLYNMVTEYVKMPPLK